MSADRFSGEARAEQRRVQAGEIPATSAWSLKDAVAGDLMAFAFDVIALESEGTADEQTVERLRFFLGRMERKLTLAVDAEREPHAKHDLSLLGERQAAVQRGEQPALDLRQLGDALRQDLASLGAYVSIIRRSGATEIAARMMAALEQVDDKTTAAFEEGWRIRRSNGDS